MNQTIKQPAFRQRCPEDGYEKGKRFEQFIIRLFNDQYFKLQNWRKSEIFSESFKAIDHWNPDLEMELIFTGRKKYRFAVECKWRKGFRDGKILWADDRKICAYRMFQAQTRIPVFVAIGIGGEPDQPEKLFLTPLDNIHMHNELNETDLVPYKRKPTRKMYYDHQLLWLF